MMTKKLNIPFEILFLSLLVLSANSCCMWSKGELQNTYNLTEEQKNLLAYTTDTPLNFLHSGGFQFQLQVIIDQGYRDNRFGDSCQDYDRFEFVNATVIGDLPLINLSFSIIQTDVNFENASAIFVSERRVNRDGALQTFVPNPTLINEFEINGVLYTDVVEYESVDPNHYLTKIYYNSTEGLLQINYLNGEYVQLQP